MGQLPCDVIGLAWNMRIGESRAAVGATKTLQGNLDPCVLYADPATIKAETERMLRQFGKQRTIANLGHGVYPDISPDHVKVFINTVKEFDWSQVES